MKLPYRPRNQSLDLHLDKNSTLRTRKEPVQEGRGRSFYLRKVIKRVRFENGLGYVSVAFKTTYRPDRQGD